MHDAERNVQRELKALRLNGMASAWAVLWSKTVAQQFRAYAG